ncbi:MAG: hypothetical protein AAF830_01835 [Pseudomonadota bacterium]
MAIAADDDRDREEDPLEQRVAEALEERLKDAPLDKLKARLRAAKDGKGPAKTPDETK